jgi:hypothetical protein
VIKKILITVLILLNAACTKNDTYKENVLSLGLAFTAQSLCSCLWVSHNSEKHCRDFVSIKQVKPTLRIDYEQKATMAKSFIIFSRRAKFLDDKRGCQLSD